MKSKRLNIFSRAWRMAAAGLLAVAATACSDDMGYDLLGGDGDEQGGEVITLELEIADDVHDVRNDLADVQFKNTWCYGDQVVLKPNSGSTTYTFTIPVPDGKQAGDPVESRVAQFVHEGSISGVNSFTGTISYVVPEVTNVSPFSDEAIKCKSYQVQASNDNSSHLACVNEMSVRLSSINLRQAKRFALSRSMGVFKVVLDGFIYPVSNGSSMWIDGFKKLTVNSNEGMGVALGSWDRHTVTIEGKRETLHGDPFFAVSDTKDPITRYAVNDGRKMVLYVPFSSDRTITSGSNLSVTLYDEWSHDLYIWSAKMSGTMKYQSGRVYTLDFTDIEPDIAIEALEDQSTFSFENRAFGYVSIKNLGAKTPTDEGSFYLFGHHSPIHPGEHYPCYPDPTPYFYLDYDNSENAYILRSKEHDTHGSARYILGSNLQQGIVIDKYTIPAMESSTDIKKFWPTRMKKELDKISSGPGGWRASNHLSAANFRKYIFYTNEILDRNGAITTERDNILGMRMTIDRTGHVLFFPATGTLVPSEFYTDEENNVPYIARNAIAERTDNFGVFPIVEAPLQYSPYNGVPSLQMLLNTFDATGAPARKTPELFVAIPFRPIYEIYGDDPRAHISIMNF